MRIGDIFRYAKQYDPSSAEVDGLPNYFFHTHSAGKSLPTLTKGINPIGIVQAVDGNRCPAILVSSSPHRFGSRETPWQDFFDTDNGHIKYYGDNKSHETEPSKAPGNKVLLEQFDIQNSHDPAIRSMATPLLFFERVSVGARIKGNLRFQGLGIIESAELIVQYDQKKKKNFTNYVFGVAVLRLSDENENFNWQWINDRREQALYLKQTLRYAPASWKEWIKNGPSVKEKYRRRVAKLLTVPTSSRKPVPGSREDKILQQVYKHYQGRNSYFEALAAEIVARIIRAGGHIYHKGWLTPKSRDGGADFIGRLDVGSDLARVKLVLLGQAKCEKLTVPTGGNHIARTVARLKRGWIGAYVTTSLFSELVQQEVIEDAYPLILVDGLRLAEEIQKAMFEAGYPNLGVFLEAIDTEYESQIRMKDPEEILLE